ncbi:MAG: hypothetical protein IJU45_01745 [Clostridia bacterium]|nr:hypothetical protein [Clostridia bacterium]
MNNDFSRDDYIEMLRRVSEKENRYPKKSDFSEHDVARIKSLFGPWPRALEAAGLIESKDEKRAEKRRLKKERKKVEKQ